MAEPRRAAGGVLHRGRRVVLLYKRLLDEYRLPKGGVDAGEDDLPAAMREVAEESGFTDLSLEADLGEVEVSWRRPDGWVEQTHRYYLLGLLSFARRPRSTKDAQRFAVLWCELEQALELISFASEREVLKRAAPYLLSGP